MNEIKLKIFSHHLATALEKRKEKLVKTHEKKLIAYEKAIDKARVKIVEELRIQATLIEDGGDLPEEDSRYSRGRHIKTIQIPMPARIPEKPQLDMKRQDRLLASLRLAEKQTIVLTPRELEENLGEGWDG